MEKIVIRRVKREDLDSCLHIEQVCYSPLEAATRDYLEKRVETYPDGFYVAEFRGEVIGMLNSGATHKDDITEERLKNLVGHVRNGRNAVLFSIAVLPEYRLRGVATKLIEKMVEVSADKEKQRILLLCKEELVSFYSNQGFRYAGRSSSDFGGFTWHQMQFELPIPTWMISDRQELAVNA